MSKSTNMYSQNNYYAVEQVLVQMRRNAPLLNRKLTSLLKCLLLKKSVLKRNIGWNFCMKANI